MSGAGGAAVDAVAEASLRPALLAGNVREGRKRRTVTVAAFTPKQTA
jgi:hypothetical protein